jgi:hypothetical protein
MKKNWFDNANSKLIDVHLFSNHQDVIVCSKDLYAVLRKKIKQNYLVENHTYVDHLKLVILNLYLQYKETNSKGAIAYFRNEHHWRGIDSRYNSLFIQREPLLAVIDALVESGFVLHKTGCPGFSSKIKAKQKLIHFIQRFHLRQEMIQVSDDKELIELTEKIVVDRGAKVKRHLPYEDTVDTVRMRADVKAYLDLLRNHNIQHPKKTFTDSQTYRAKRVFRNTFDQCGRIYAGWWQSSVRSEARTLITIDGEETVELDFCNYQVRVAKALIGIDYSEDGYNLPGYRSKTGRKILKNVLLFMFNCCSRLRTTRAAQKAINDNTELKKFWLRKGRPKMSTLVEKMEKKHADISQWFFSENGSKGLELQFHDSEICMNIINIFVEKKIPILTIHDSFIVQKKHQSLLAETMVDAFEQYTGVLIRDPKSLIH